VHLPFFELELTGGGSGYVRGAHMGIPKRSPRWLLGGSLSGKKTRGHSRSGGQRANGVTDTAGGGGKKVNNRPDQNGPTANYIKKWKRGKWPGTKEKDGM